MRFTFKFGVRDEKFIFNFFFFFIGELQRVGGIKNPPNIQYGSPSKYYADCIHPTSEGYDILMTKFFKDLKQRGFFQ